MEDHVPVRHIAPRIAVGRIIVRAHRNTAR